MMVERNFDTMLADKQKTVARIVFGVYLLLLTWLILFKLSFTPWDVHHARCLNLLPLIGSDPVEVSLNVLAFLPLGVYLQVFIEKHALWKTLLLGFALSLLYESLQYICALGVSDVTDLLANTAGCAGGLVLYNTVKKAIPDRHLTVWNLLGVACILFSLAFALYLWL